MVYKCPYNGLQETGFAVYKNHNPPELYNFLTPLSSFTPQSTCPNNYVFLSTRCARVPSIPALFRYSSFLTPSKRVALSFDQESMTISFKKRQASQLGLVEDFRLRTLYFVLFYF